MTGHPMLAERPLGGAGRLRQYVDDTFAGAGTSGRCVMPLFLLLNGVVLYNAVFHSPTIRYLPAGPGRWGSDQPWGKDKANTARFHLASDARPVWGEPRRNARAGRGV